MKVAVVGGGWAGLSAAVTAARLGHQVRVFEAAPSLGGRARTVRHPALDMPIDNGQHLLLGAYTATLELMRSLGLEEADCFHTLPLFLRSADGTLSLRTLPGLPAPLHLAAGLLTAKGLHWTEKAAALRALHHLRQNDWQTPRAATVQEWLALSLQPARLQEQLWRPLCVATMNTPVEQACAQLFAHVLRDSVGSGRRDAGHMLIPRRGLSELWPERVAQLAADGTLVSGGPGSLDIVPNTPIRQLHPAAPGGMGDVAGAAASPASRWRLNERPELYDAVLLCGNVPATARLLAGLPPSPAGLAFLESLTAFAHAPIATLTLELSRPLRLPAPMLLLHECRERGHFGQWLFQGQDAHQRLLHIVVSDAQAMLAVTDREALLTGMIEQLSQQLRGICLPEIRRHALITEKRATFLAVPGLQRPGNRTPWPGIWVAGDWTNTGYPAVLEGAVRSGRQAALEMDGQCRRP